MEQIMKAELPNFVKIVCISKGKEEGEWISFNSRINPYHITSYYEAFILSYKGEAVKKVVVFTVGGNSFSVDMTVEEADKMMDDIDRSLSFKENG